MRRRLHCEAFSVAEIRSTRGVTDTLRQGASVESFRDWVLVVEVLQRDRFYQADAENSRGCDSLPGQRNARQKSSCPSTYLSSCRLSHYQSNVNWSKQTTLCRAKRFRSPPDPARCWLPTLGRCRLSAAPLRHSRLSVLPARTQASPGLLR